MVGRQLLQVRRAEQHQRVGAARQIIHLDDLRPQRDAGVAGRHQEAGVFQDLQIAVERRPAVAELAHQILGRPFQPLLGKHLEDRKHPFQAVLRLHASRRMV